MTVRASASEQAPLVHHEFHRGWTLALWTVLATFTLLLITETGGVLVLVGLLSTSLLVLTTHSQILRANEVTIELRWGAGWRRAHAPWSTLRSVEFGPSPTGTPVWAMGCGTRHRYGLGGRELLVLHFEDGGQWQIGLHDAHAPGRALRRRLEASFSGPPEPGGPR